MIPAGAGQIPVDGDELAERIAASLRDALHLRSNDVSVTAQMGAPDAVDRLEVDLSGSVVDDRYLSRTSISLRPPRSTAGGVPTELQSLTLTGRPVTAFGAPVSVQMEAHQVPATWLHDDSGQLWLAFRDEPSTNGSTSGHAVVEGDVAAVSAAATTVAAEVGRKKGVTIKDVKVTPRTAGPNRWSVDLEAKVTKGIASANVTGHAEIRLDDDMVVHVEDLTAKAGGMIGKLASGIIESMLGRYRNRTIDLKKQTFAGAHVTAVDVELAERFKVTATLGS